MNTKEIIAALHSLKLDEFAIGPFCRFAENLPDQNKIIEGLIEVYGMNNGSRYLNLLKKDCEHILRIGKPRRLKDLLNISKEGNKEQYNAKYYPSIRTQKQNNKYYLVLNDKTEEITIFEYRTISRYISYLDIVQTIKKEKDEILPELERRQYAYEKHYSKFNESSYNNLKEEYEELDNELLKESNSYLYTVRLYEIIVDWAEIVLRCLKDLKEGNMCDKLRLDTISRFFAELGIDTNYDWANFLLLKSTEKYNGCNKHIIAFCCEEFEKAGLIKTDGDWFNTILNQLDIKGPNYICNKSRNVKQEIRKKIAQFISDQKGYGKYE